MSESWLDEVVFDSEGLIPAIGLLVLPLAIFIVLVKVLPPWTHPTSNVSSAD